MLTLDKEMAEEKAEQLQDTVSVISKYCSIMMYDGIYRYLLNILNIELISCSFISLGG